MLSTRIHQSAAKSLAQGSRKFHSSHFAQRVIGTQPLHASQATNTFSPKYEVIDHTYDAL
ncbi:hypothetical protein IW150_004956, partial [Coemansia sp. RSA 2607]